MKIPIRSDLLRSWRSDGLPFHRSSFKESLYLDWRPLRPFPVAASLPGSAVGPRNRRKPDGAAHHRTWMRTAWRRARGLARPLEDRTGPGRQLRACGGLGTVNFGGLAAVLSSETGQVSADRPRPQGGTRRAGRGIGRQWSAQTGLPCEAQRLRGRCSSAPRRSSCVAPGWKNGWLRVPGRSRCRAQRRGSGPGSMQTGPDTRQQHRRDGDRDLEQAGHRLVGTAGGGQAVGWNGA